MLKEIKFEVKPLITDIKPSDPAGTLEKLGMNHIIFECEADVVFVKKLIKLVGSETNKNKEVKA